MEQWKGFKGDKWKTSVDTRDFIQRNYTEYTGDDSFLEPIAPSTDKLWTKLQELFEVQHQQNGVYDMDNNVPATLTSHEPGYLIKEEEKIVGLQTDVPLKQAFMPFGGINMANNALTSNGYEVDPEMTKIFTELRKTHNQGVFDAYTPEMRAARKNKIITGLPDAYGRGRIIGDYRRIALYGIDRLIEEKMKDLSNTGYKSMTEDVIRLREEITEQIRALGELKKMAASYGFDISQPAGNAREAIQWLYFGYLGAIKSQNGAAMSIGRISAFLDIYIQRDLENGTITEFEAQELIDHLIMKLRMVKFARTPEYNQLFSGYPIWATLSIAGMALSGRSLVTKNDFRILHTLTNMGPSPEPNLTVLYSSHLPEGFRTFAAKIAKESSSIQFENDDLLRANWGSDDCAIACCVSATVMGKDMQFFGARANLAKAALYAINGGIDEKTKAQVGPKFRPMEGDTLDFDEFIERYKDIMDWLAELYVNTLNVIHYMHDKYAYEAAQLAFMDSDLKRTFATGIAGISHATDSVMAIKYGNVKVIRDEDGVAVDYVPQNEFPTYGNDNEEADEMANWILEYFMTQIKRHHTYRNARPTTSLLTITSNVVYGKATGNTPDGRRAGKPLAPGANPSYQDGKFLGEKNGLLASLNSTARLEYTCALDGISNTQTINPNGLGKDDDIRIDNLRNVMDGYFDKGGYHLNVNVFTNELLLDAQAHPEKYPNLTIRVSGYAVKFRDLTPEQQADVISRTSHDRM
ncbi:formate C-acetyltransferase [Melissococcus plutonius]|uniref:Formate acetyltransferase n=1 Tax=Melissococcus plutonius (strain ATCC 35311 / DSM 29964 / CIP 104052 / LMG 20360 / NCIMB 702443) TaxID=940190 RepID=F3YAN6_MELPT|nr:formate C-acetyltransferase [Melissococcus plutonius]KMT32364.1 formate acetyltransferase PflB [Melissococcus plutonius]KMT34936.1 formate acetyltransferase PflB [Melissococcus plutonius]MBB5178371.1 formate C-acetyltransferase [Melissococcus plutonius]BAK21564.1 pyruvate formate-lyase [Melissococcus plutonius ATCC 35311]BBD15347.1 pyruvate formate-lyase [Melissococcus plutonius]